MDVALLLAVAVPDPVSLTDLLSTPITPTVRDAVALIVQLAHSPQTGRPNRQRLDASHVLLHADGAVTLSPGLYPPVWEVAGLLDYLLGRVETASGMPRGLVAIVEAGRRHTGFTIPTLSALSAALTPFRPPDPADAVRALVGRLDAPAAVAPASEPEIVPDPPPLPVVREPVPHEPAPVDAETLPRSWRPSTWHMTAAFVAVVIAAILGGAVGRSRHASEAARDVPAIRQTPPAETATPPSVTPATETPTKVTPATVTPIASPPASPIAPRPARLVDHRAVHADGVFSPSFAAHGSAVFFHAKEGGESALKRADTSDDGELQVATIVDAGARNYHVQVSPDGGSIAFDSDRDGERGVYVAKANGTGVQRVSGPGYAAVPTWSPDGRRLALLRAEPDRPAVWNLWLLDRDTGKQTRVTTFRSGQVWGGTWFADGKRIAYSHEDRLSIHDLATNTSREFASPLRGRLIRTPAVSPDGRWIVFQVYRDGAWLLDVERGAMQRVLQDPSAEEFAWSPDGRRVAYHSQRSGGWNLWTMAAP